MVDHLVVVPVVPLEVVGLDRRGTARIAEELIAGNAFFDLSRREADMALRPRRTARVCAFMETIARGLLRE